VPVKGITRSGESRIFDIQTHYKKTFFTVVKNADFLKFIKGLSLLVEVGVERPKTRKQKKRVNPTVGFKFWNLVW
jgi:hypothetical protein